MKLTLVLLISLFPLALLAQTVTLNDWNTPVTDITTRNQTKESLFNGLNRDLVKVGESICSNRALMWVYDLKRHHNIEAAKMFLFYTGKTGHVGRKTWWYHVTPVVNEKGQLFTIDAGFPGFIDGPLTLNEWLHDFVGSSSCKEIKATDTDLIERMFSGRVFPESTAHGRFDCYYMLAPAGYWTPASVAMGLLGRDENGTPVHYVRDQIDTDEVYSACVEASTSTLGRVFSNPKKKCKRYVSYGIR